VPAGAAIEAGAELYGLALHPEHAAPDGVPADLTDEVRVAVGEVVKDEAHDLKVDPGKGGATG